MSDLSNAASKAASDIATGAKDQAQGVKAEARSDIQAAPVKAILIAFGVGTAFGIIAGHVLAAVL